MKTLKVILTINAAMLCALSCQKKIDRDTAIAELMQNERAFSQYAEDHGAAEAFKTFMADSAVMFRLHPVKGRDSIMAKMFSKPSKTKLTWAPMFADVSESGELGYTYGPYERIVPDSVNGERRYTGYFITVWKKQNDGKWKFVLDTGTEPAPMSVQKEK